jgi:hypothetical protein
MSTLMFAPIDDRPSLKARLKQLLLPATVALLMNIPLEVDLHTAVKRHDYDLQRFELLYFPTAVITVLSFGPPLVWTIPDNVPFAYRNPDWSFLAKDADSWAMTVINVLFYTLAVFWCRYSIMDGFMVGLDTVEFRRYRPFLVGIVLLSIGCIGVAAVQLYWRRIGAADTDDMVPFYFLACTGAFIVAPSIIVVVGRKLRLRSANRMGTISHRHIA